jgi:dihydrofolate synthase / folylpolyglutamate synthase
MYRGLTSVKITCRDEAIAWLYGRIDYERVSSSLTAADFKLERMRNLLDRLGNPQERVPVVHIAGTKGKGSTAALISSVLRAAGYTVGLFTSPHIDRFEERIRISGQEIPGSAMTTLVSRLATVSQEIDASDEGRSPTFFELTTALAWLWFVESKVDIAVLEVGLGFDKYLSARSFCHHDNQSGSHAHSGNATE